MKHRFYPVFWLLVVALIGPGALPGLVVCFGQAGHVEVETTQDRCCSTYAQQSPQRTFSLLATTSAPAADSSCGRCTDTPISQTPLVKPAQAGKASVAGEQITTLAFAPVTIGMDPYSANPSVAADATLILIRSTTLLI